MALLVAMCGLLGMGGLIFARSSVPDPRPAPLATKPGATSSKIRFAVLGDSDSQSYHDTLMLGDPSLRGGPYRATTYQWTEILARLRGDQIDFGEWGPWGTGKYRAYLNEIFGSATRTPAKQDYRYNFAVSGASCGQLMGRPQRQAIRLVDLMDTEPAAWRGGIVLIRIGINDVGAHDVLDELARDPDASRPAALINACVAAIGEAVALIRGRHPDTNVVLVGVLSNADWSGEFDNWQSGKEIANIDAGMARFDQGLSKLAEADSHVYFRDDRAWFRDLWGARDAEGRPFYKTVRLSSDWAVTNSSGDDPHNAVLSDNHAGVVWNTLWAQDLVTSLNGAFGLHLKPITQTEVVSFLKPSFVDKGS